MPSTYQGMLWGHIADKLLKNFRGIWTKYTAVYVHVHRPAMGYLVVCRTCYLKVTGSSQAAG